MAEPFFVVTDRQPSCKRIASKMPNLAAQNYPSMKLLVEIPDENADFFLKLLQQLNYVKATPFDKKAEGFYDGLRDAVEEVNLSKEGKIKLKTARELLDEL